MTACAPQRIRIGDASHQAGWLRDTRAGQDVLRAAHDARANASCLCVAGGVSMYVARRGAHYYLARMPGTGLLHATACPSAEDANLLSGADAYAPGLIREADDGMVSIDFGTGGGVDLDGLLDLLIEAAELNILRGGEPRGWPAVRERLRAAAESLSISSGQLQDFLLLPVSFNKEGHTAERAAQARFLSGTDAPRLVCAPLREIRPSPYGWQLQLKHLPDLRFWLSRKGAGAYDGRHGGTLPLTAPPPYCLALLRVRPGRTPDSFAVADLALRQTDRRFMPCLSETEAKVAEAFADHSRSFMRPLRFSIGWERALADYALLDCARAPALVFVLAPTGSALLDAAKQTCAGAFRHVSAGRAAIHDCGRWLSPPPDPLPPQTTTATLGAAHAA